MNRFLRPPGIFLLDGSGALISAFSLGILLPLFQEFIGMPLEILWILAGIAALFALYSLTCYRAAGDKWKRLLTLIAIANGAYAILSLALVVIHFDMLKIWGLLYFGGEILILIGLITLEIKTIRAN